jgi:hypothetical protein
MSCILKSFRAIQGNDEDIKTVKVKWQEEWEPNLLEIVVVDVAGSKTRHDQILETPRCTYTGHIYTPFPQHVTLSSAQSHDPYYI